ncbi:hypothetical protein ON010_g6209 [Phytophthora cinnamomi]|nr:hypothetical protein ON010_g6209 [Phytophthora cinnamomi]
MRFVWKALQSTVAFLAILNSTSAARYSKATSFLSASGVQGLPARQNRYLRAVSTFDANEEEEERAVSVKIFGVDKLKNVANTRMVKVAGSVQLGKWELQRKSGDEVLKLLELDKVGKDLLLGNPQIYSLGLVYDEDQQNAPENGYSQAPDTTQLATRLQVAQMRDWVRRGTSVDDAMTLLKFDDNVKTVLINPGLGTLEVYITQLNKLDPKKRTTVTDALRDSYGDEAVAKMLEAARKAKTTPNTEKLAQKLQNSQFDQWFTEGAKPAIIWKMLNMEKATWMKNPDADVWRRYLAFYKLQKAKATSTTL